MKRLVLAEPLLLAAFLVLGAKSAIAQSQPQCAVIHHGARVELQSRTFTFSLDTSDGLRARAWKNQLTGREISLGLGPELELDFDTAEQRIWITGWKQESDQRLTHVFLPQNAADKKLTLTLGGFGVYDYRHIDVSINGQVVGSRKATGRWREPGTFDLGPGTRIHSFLRFGEENILTVRCQDQILRTKRMDEYQEQLALPGPADYPAQFEQYLTVGTPLTSPSLRVTHVVDRCHASHGEALVQLESKDKSTQVSVRYEWNSSDPVLHKFVELSNLSHAPHRLMNLRLGDYTIGRALSPKAPSSSPVPGRALSPKAPPTTISEGEQGFPVYVADEFFLSLAHPSGWAISQDNRALLRQYPGKLLGPRDRFESMEAVLGVAAQGQAREAFVSHVRSRSRRVLRHHDKPYAIYETFGGWIAEEYALTEKYVLEMLDKLEQGKKEAGYQFDLCNTHFWVDNAGDLERFAPERFPHGFTNIKARLDELGIKPGLWIDSSWRPWTIGRNPIVYSTYTHDPAYENGLYGLASLCRATDPIRTMYSTAFQYHIRQNGIRLVKCDNLHAICYNPNHPHLPGVYSTEAIHSAIIHTLDDWDSANPDVFLMLYWGHRSPWWLLHGDTISEHGLNMEAATPGPSPTLFMRDGVTVRLDEGNQWREDVAALGKDTLGIWLSDWAWNSHIGKERWQEAFVMDMCRGSMLAQIWTDYPWLSSPERKQLADFIALLKAEPQCFGNARLILGEPLKHEPYGYSCSDGKRAFIALNNCSWADLPVRLKLNAKWGLTNLPAMDASGRDAFHGVPDPHASSSFSSSIPFSGLSESVPNSRTPAQWDIYRWYPNPARLQQDNLSFQQSATISLRPFQVVLLEVVPHGQAPTLDRHFELQSMPAGFDEPSRSLELDISGGPVAETSGAAQAWAVLQPVTAVANAGTMLTRQDDNSLLASGRDVTPQTYTVTAETELTNITGIRLEVLPDPSLPGGGPGRGPNGNFCLNEFRATIAPLRGSGPTQRLLLENPTADFSRQTDGGWPVAAAIDGDSSTGWQIDPEESQPHEAIFQLKEPAGFAGGSKLTFVLDQVAPEDHTLGRFRFSVTAAQPVPSPRFSPRSRWLINGEAPASTKGGTLVVSAEPTLNGNPYLLTAIQSRFVSRTSVAGQEVPCEPVLRGPGAPATWQAWRLAIGAGDPARAFQFDITAKIAVAVRFTFQAHFIPVD